MSNHDLPVRSLAQLVNLRTEKQSGVKSEKLPYVGLEHIASGDSILIGFSRSDASVSTNSTFYAGDILFGKLRPNLRKSLRAPFDGYCSTDILVLEPAKDVDPGFAARVFQCEDVFAEAIRTSEGTKMPRTSWSRLKDCFVFAPKDKEEQRRIAEILDAADEAIAKTEALIAKLKQMKSGLLHDLLTRGLDENGQLRDPIAHPEQFKDSPLGKLPNSWSVTPIIAAAVDSSGSTAIGPFGSNLMAKDYRSTGVPVTFVRDVKAGGYEWNSYVYVDEQKAAELSAHSVCPGDLIATKMGLPPCIACVYPEWMSPGIITADIIRLSPERRIALAKWLALFVNSDAVCKQVRAITGGVTRPKVTLADFRRLLVALPGIDEQNMIVGRLDSYEARIHTEEAYRDKLKQIKKGLMHDLLTGRV